MHLRFSLTRGAGRTLELWTPTQDDTHRVWTEGLEGLSAQAVTGGRLISATVSADAGYSIGVEPR